MGENVGDPGFGNESFQTKPKAQSMKKNLINETSLKFKAFAARKTLLR